LAEEWENRQRSWLSSRQLQVMPSKKIPAQKPKTCLKNQPWGPSDFVQSDLSTNATGVLREMKGITTAAEAQSTE